MCALYGTRVVQKSDALEMRLAGRGLEALGIMTKERFMSRYTTVWGRRVYPWFTIGRGDADALWRQIVVCVHEHQHVEQFDREGLVRYAARYGFSTRARALLEAEAYACNVELHWWRHRSVLDPAKIAHGLLHYGCDESDIAEAEAVLRQRCESLPDEGILNRATLRAIEILDEWC